MRGPVIRNDPGQILLEWGPDERRSRKAVATIAEAFALCDQLKADPTGFGYEWLKTTGLIEESEA